MEPLCYESCIYSLDWPLRSLIHTENTLRHWNTNIVYFQHFYCCFLYRFDLFYTFCLCTTINLCCLYMFKIYLCLMYIHVFPAIIIIIINFIRNLLTDFYLPFLSKYFSHKFTAGVTVKNLENLWNSILSLLFAQVWFPPSQVHPGLRRKCDIMSFVSDGSGRQPHRV